MSRIHNTALNIASNRPLQLTLRTLQFIFAVIVLGTTAHAIRVFKPFDVTTHFSYGTFVDHIGVPSAWGFMAFCALWTLQGVVFLIVAGHRYSSVRLVGYVRVFVESVALVSWLAGFISLAINLGANVCSAEEKGCGPLQAAVVFGSLEWLLFIVTATVTYALVLGRKETRHQPHITAQVMSSKDQENSSIVLSYGTQKE
ncbi:hypothetical protein SEUCBS140593_001706 [Sporothrix eucalyptigena]|uniref:MARVEL domain-containing protein n=1 Tax=Sporothrix eucalyptigena TaxID=1812306 RepID=A0ABP0B0J6_9PEZI